MQVGDVQFQRSGGRRPVAWFASSARLMASLKRVGRLAQIDVSVAGAAAAVSVGNIGAATANWKCCGSDHFITGPVARASTTARWIACSSSRTLPAGTTAAAGFAPPQPK
ncbi:hypothetical protein KPZU09_77210 [Klebsiella pneumoniae]|uniref:Uncharacterized protein n=1 Tax=Klebsiella pneumoniae TaxID=573 RepID=A0A919LZF4_KLEPN|nr:hypothetical protein KPZU09_77210 [Klebsiella pneumoniae]